MTGRLCLAGVSAVIGVFALVYGLVNEQWWPDVVVGITVLIATGRGLATHQRRHPGTGTKKASGRLLEYFGIHRD